MNLLVLLSGGIDSTVCMANYFARGDQVSAVFVDYAQPNLEAERSASQAVASYYGSNLEQIGIVGLQTAEGYIPGRNAFLVATALNIVHFENGCIALGIHSGTQYADCGPVYLELMNRLADLYFDGRIEVVAPFVDWTKSEILDYGKRLEVPFDLTFSSNWTEDTYKRGSS